LPPDLKPGLNEAPLADLNSGLPMGFGPDLNPGFVPALNSGFGSLLNSFV
jgi:hypothetical protein